MVHHIESEIGPLGNPQRESGIPLGGITDILSSDDRRTVGGYFDKRITSPHQAPGNGQNYLISAAEHNDNLPDNLWLICGDPSLEIQAQVISQIGGQTLPQDSWKNVHNWLLDLVTECQGKFGKDKVTVFIDCNPSFSAYTELAMMASENLIIPCSSDGSSARAIANIGALLYGIGDATYEGVDFKSKAKEFSMPLPAVHSVILNRSTQYNKKASKAFTAMFDEIKKRVVYLREQNKAHFVCGDTAFYEIPDTHSVAIVCSHLGLPLYDVKTKSYYVHGKNTKVNSLPLDRYKTSIGGFVKNL